MIRIRKNHRTGLRLATQDTAPFRWLKQRHDSIALERWNDSGRREPPPHAFKRSLVIWAAAKSNADLFIETGTFYGDMVDAVRERFLSIISIELDPTLHELARQRFRGDKRIQLLCGNSEILLPELLERIHEPGVFWLDAHYSGARTALAQRETPIVTELVCLLAHPVKKHVILIDDARCFDGSHDYPAVADLEQIFAPHARDYTWSIEDDVIQVWPRMHV
jgi:hypothetical protein